MRVFISWSGERSQALGQALYDWLPLALPDVQPWLSQADISAGDRWAQVVAKELESSNFGIICVTPENLNAAWILFEAGALAKSLQGAKVIPLLLGLDFSQISGPLAQFQAKKLGKVGVSEIVQSINQSAPAPEPAERATNRFEGLWPTFETKLAAIPTTAPGATPSRPQPDVLEELVATVRGFETRFARLEEALVEFDPRSRRRRRPLHPMILDEISAAMSEEGDEPIALLMLAGTVRDEVPWLYELIVEAAREIRTGNPTLAHRAVERLQRATKMLRRGPLAEELGMRDAHHLVMELPRILEHTLARMAPAADRDASH